MKKKKILLLLSLVKVKLFSFLIHLSLLLWLGFFNFIFFHLLLRSICCCIFFNLYIIFSFLCSESSDTSIQLTHWSISYFDFVVPSSMTLVTIGHCVRVCELVNQWNRRNIIFFSSHDLYESWMSSDLR